MKGVARICKVISQRRTSIHKPLTSFLQLMFASGKEENEKSLDYCTLIWSSWIIEGKSWSRTVNNSLTIWIPSKVNPFIHNSYFVTFFWWDSCSIKPATLFNRYRYNPLFTGTFKEQLGMLDIKQRSTWPTIKFLGLWFCY